MGNVQHQWTFQLKKCVYSLFGGKKKAWLNKNPPFIEECSTAIAMNTRG